MNPAKHLKNQIFENFDLKAIDDLEGLQIQEILIDSFWKY